MIKFDMQTIQLISLFEKITHAQVKDCFIEPDKMVFIVKNGDVGRAVGKGGSNIKRLETKFKKKVRIIEHSDDIHEFIQNVVYPNKLANVEEQGKILLITAKDTKTRGMIIGRAAANLRWYESIVKRYFDIDEIKVN